MYENCAILLSLLAWERGLKYPYNTICFNASLVAPCVGVWIETYIVMMPPLVIWSLLVVVRIEISKCSSTCADSDGHFLHSYKVQDVDMRA